MVLIFRMKTGFFEKTSYRLEIVEKGMLLIPVKEGNAEQIALRQEALLSVTLTEGRYPELEIQTRNAVYAGVLEDECPFGSVVSYLNENLNVKIICEYKGGD